MSPCTATFAKRWVFTTWLEKELYSAKITLPDFSFKIRIEQGRKLKHIKAENICSEKKWLTIFLPSVPIGCPDWLLFLRLDPTTAVWIDRKAVFTKFDLLKSWSQQNPFLFLKIQASNEIIWFKMRRPDQRNPRRLSLEFCTFRFHEIKPSLSTCLRYKTIISK